MTTNSYNRLYYATLNTCDINFKHIFHNHHKLKENQHQDIFIIITFSFNSVQYLVIIIYPQKQISEIVYATNADRNELNHYVYNRFRLYEIQNVLPPRP